MYLKEEELKKIIKQSGYKGAKARMYEMLLKNENNLVKTLKESTLSGDMAILGDMITPLFRRVYPQLISKNIVGVQPISQSVGYIFALRHSIGGNSNSNLDKNSSELIGPIGGTKNSGAGNEDNQRTTPNTVAIVYDTTANRQADINDVGPGESTYGNLPGGSALTSILSSPNLSVIYAEGRTAIIQFDPDATGDEKQSIIDLKTTTGSNVEDVTDNEMAYRFLFDSYAGSPYSTFAAEVLGLDTQEVNINIDKIRVECETRKLKTRYTVESEQDIEAVFGVDFVDYLAEIMSYEIAASIDRQILNTIENNVLESTTYPVNTETAGLIAGENDGRWRGEKFHNAYIEMIRKANDIAKTTLRGPGNFIVAHPDVNTMLMDIRGASFKRASMESNDTAGEGASENYWYGESNQENQNFLGTIDGRFKIYNDPYSTTKRALIGYKGEAEGDAGIIWSPYVPVSVNLTSDAENDNRMAMFSERSAITKNIWGAENYYRKITFTGLFE